MDVAVWMAQPRFGWFYIKKNWMYRIYVYIYEHIFVFEKTDFENSLAVCKVRPISDWQFADSRCENV